MWKHANHIITTQYFLILYILPLDEAIRKAEINRELKNEKNIY